MIGESTLSIQYCSDLHVEQHGSMPPLVRSAPYLALLGDLGEWEANQAEYQRFVAQCSRVWVGVFLVAGNHEFHGSKTMGTTRAEMRAFCDGLGNVHFLDNSVANVEGVRFLGTTLWSHVDDAFRAEVERLIPDFSRVTVAGDSGGGDPRPLTTRDTNALHQEALRWLEAALADARRDGVPVVVLSHHAPLDVGTSHPKYEVPENRGVNSAYASDLAALVRWPVRAWLFGHTHHATWLLRGDGVQVCSNPRGSPEERLDFEPHASVDVAR